MAPILTGTMDISKGSLMVPMTGMTYNFNGNLSTEKQKLIVDNIQLKYPGEDDRFINMNGYIDLTNLTLNDLDLNMYGDVKILDNSVTYNDLGVYGDVYGGSGNPNIHIKLTKFKMLNILKKRMNPLA